MVGDADEPELVSLAASGDRAALNAIASRHYLAVWKMARYRLGNRADAEDAVQETFLKAQRSLAAFRGDCPLITWLRTICWNQCTDLLRRREQRTATSVDAVLERSPSGDRPLASLPTSLVTAPESEATLFSLELRRALGALTEEEREAFLLVKGLDLSVTEGARVLG